MAQLRGLVSDRLALLLRGVELRKAGNSQAAIVSVGTGGGLRLMSEIGATLDRMTAEEGRLLALRQASAATSARLVQLGAAAAFLLIGAIGALVFRYTRRSYLALSAAHDQLALTHQDLVEQVGQREQAESFSCARRRRWKRSASSRAASRTTSTTCWA